MKRKSPARKKQARKPAARKAGSARKPKVSFIPQGYHTVTPYLACRDAARALEFYAEAFGAREVLRMPAPEGRIDHAEVRIGDSRVMLADEHPDMDFRSPEAGGGPAVHLHLYVKDVDGMVERATSAGATVVREVTDQFYGDRSGSVKDPFGHVWHLATHKEDLSKAELRKRTEKARQERGGG